MGSWETYSPKSEASADFRGVKWRKHTITQGIVGKENPKHTGL